MNEKNKLSEKQKKLCDEYLLCGSVVQAALKAGYSKSTACGTAYRILKTAAAEEYMAQKSTRTPLTEMQESSKEISDYLRSVMRGEKWNGERPSDAPADLPAEKDGTITVKDRMKAAELLGKLYGVFSEKPETEEILPVIISGEDKLSD